jgi:hypothetical protein
MLLRLIKDDNLSEKQSNCFRLRDPGRCLHSLAGTGDSKGILETEISAALSPLSVTPSLGSIHRDFAIGKRVYGMFSLTTTYGMRACEYLSRFTLSRF